MVFDEIRNMLVDAELEKLIIRYNVEFRNGTMIINKKIPVNDFIELRKRARKIEQVDDIIVDGDLNSYVGLKKI